MNGLLRIGNEYMKESDWRDLSLIKFCLCAMGVLIGIALPPKARKRAVPIAISVFIVTYIPLMMKLFRVMGLTEQKKSR